MLDHEQLAEFAERGYLLVPDAVPEHLLAAASRAVDGLEPPPPQLQGPHHHFLDAAQYPPLQALLTDSQAFSLAECLTGPGTLDVPPQVQVALNIPPFPHRPGMHHIDGAPHEPDGRPGTFTLLAGILLTDQLSNDMGNLWVWPGTHLTHAAYFREHGPEAFFDANGYPPIALPEPEQITGRAGDLLLAHYLLGHNIGGNTSTATRCAVYFRIKRTGHDPHWRAFLQDPWFDYAPFR
ncbi:phytanoyl-CoA dioxygenase family protein [Streptacidiphilus cavernicola]|uniref:Phytanoyl-CoA dioxygenase family protein n=1 Tax=Streptacidiphilus cavernicola TaxID=3342716 RepID=A0ABV6W4V7_9ACTN